MAILSVSLLGADYSGLSYIGVRIGAGHSDLGEPDETFLDYRADVQETGFYTEVFFNWHFMNEFALEVALAALNRGEFRWFVPNTGNFFGTINLYPIMVGLKLKPLASQLSRYYQPYISGGGSVIVGRAVIDGGSVANPYLYYNPDAESETALGWWAGFGFESFVSTTICITSSFRYQYMKFGEPIGGYEDHTGYQISFGIAYIFTKEER